MSRPSIEHFIMVGPLNLAADSDAVKWPLFVTKRRIRVKAAFFGATAALTAQDTNYNKIAVMNGTTELKSITTGPASSGESLAAGDLERKDLTTPLEVAADGIIEVNFTKTGSGQAVTGLVVGIAYEDYDT